MLARRDRARATNVLAAVVTYNPGEDLIVNLEALAAQADVCVVDNGSRNVAAVEAAVRRAGCRAIFNAQNLGIAAALNQAARIGEAEGFEWLATFDQDSLVAEGAITRLLDMYALHARRERIAILAMARRDRGTGRDYQAAWSILEDTPSWRSVRSSITSGSLIKLSVLRSVGGFDETLFIDSVDHDICLQCRKAGYLVIEDKSTVMAHSLGVSTSHSLFGRAFCITDYPPTRHYYIVRNLLEMVVRAVRYDMTLATRAFVHLLIGIVKVVVFERGRGPKLAAMAEGGRDFLLRRFGPRPMQS
jgi:rhamnosyltransferase